MVFLVIRIWKALEKYRGRRATRLSLAAEAALGDVNDDGRADLFAGRLDESAHVWLNEGVAGLVEYRPNR